MCRFYDFRAVASLIVEGLICVFIGIFVPGGFFLASKSYFGLDFILKPWLFVSDFNYFGFFRGMFFQSGKYHVIIAIYFGFQLIMSIVSVR